MADSLDHYEVEAMIRDAGYRYASRDDLHTTAADLRAAVAELRAELEVLRATIASVDTTLNARTEHLA